MNIKDTSAKVVHGHEAWMEDYVSHSHAGDPIMAMVKWGHNAVLDGKVDMNVMTYKLCAPDGTISEVECEIGDEDCFDLTSFDTYEEGYYTFIADYDNCWAKYGERDEDYKFGDRKEYTDALEVRNYKQYATLTVPVGHFHATELKAIPDMQISILPAVGSGFMESHSITFNALFKGQPLADTDAVIIRLLDDGTTVETAVKTDANGVITYVPDAMGTYVIIIRTTDEIADADGRYEGTSYTASHSFRVSEHNHNAHHHGDHEECEHHHDHSDLDELLDDHDHEHHHHHHDDEECEHHHHHDDDEHCAHHHHH